MLHTAHRVAGLRAVVRARLGGSFPESVPLPAQPPPLLSSPDSADVRGAGEISIIIGKVRLSADDSGLRPALPPSLRSRGER